MSPATSIQSPRRKERASRRRRRTIFSAVIASIGLLVASVPLGAGALASATDYVGMFPAVVSPATLTDPDHGAVQLGMKFHTDVDGTISGVKFYKGPMNRGTHTATLWSSSGARLATATFTAELAAGWQTAYFVTPVAISAGKTYTASYIAPQGGYAVSEGGFDQITTSGHISAAVGAGVYRYGTRGFPRDTYNNSNYFVDVLFSPGATAPISLSAPTPSLAPTPAPTVATPPTTVVPSGSVTLRQVDGGTGYYGKYLHGLPTASSFFPIGVWFESVLSSSDTATDAQAGINTYVAITSNSSLSTVTNSGMNLITEETSPLNNGSLLNDEVDMTSGPGAGYTVMEAAIRNAPAGVMTYANYGKGVTFWESDAEAATFVGYPNLLSADNYWFTDPNICGPSEGGWGPGTGSALSESDCRLASNYGWTVDRVRSLQQPASSKPVWNFVEVGHPFTEDWAPTITGPQIRAAVWSGIIHGARGVIYFNHNFGGSCLSQHVLRDSCGAGVRPTVTAVNQQITALAPILNSPFVDGLITTTGKVDTAVKVYQGSYYLIAGSAQQGAQSATFASKCASATTATVLGENRTVPVTNGRFADSFADGNAVHLYKINGGTCGIG